MYRETRFRSQVYLNPFLHLTKSCSGVWLLVSGEIPEAGQPKSFRLQGSLCQGNFLVLKTCPN